MVKERFTFSANMKLVIQSSVRSHAETAYCIVNALKKHTSVDVFTVSLSKYYSYSADSYIKQLGWPVYEILRSRKGDQLTYQDYKELRREFREIITKIAPDFLLLGDDHPPLQIGLIQEARKKRIPSILIQEGPFNPWIINKNQPNPYLKKIDNSYVVRTNRNLDQVMSFSTMFNKIKVGMYSSINKRIRRSPPTSRGYGYGGADIFAVMSNQYKNLWIDGGVPSDTIRVTGQPRYDRLYQLYEKKEINNLQKKTVLVLSQPLIKYCEYGKWSTEQVKKLFMIYDRAAEFLKHKYQVNIRFHPSETLSDYPWWSKEIKYLNIVPTQKDIYNEILQSDVIVTVFSTAGFEAILLGKPIITVRDPYSYPAVWDKIPNSSINVTNSIDLANAIQNIQLECSSYNIDHIRKQLIDCEFDVFDGKASDRVAQLILTYKSKGSTSNP